MDVELLPLFMTPALNVIVSDGHGEDFWATESQVKRFCYRLDKYASTSIIG